MAAAGGRVRASQCMSSINTALFSLKPLLRHYRLNVSVLLYCTE